MLAAQGPDIVVIDKCQKVLWIVDVAILSDYNVTVKETEKIEKHRDLSIKLSLSWKMKCELIPIISGGLGCVTDMLQKLIINQFVL